MNREDKIYQMMGTLEYLYSRLREEKKIYNNLQSNLLTYNQSRNRHLLGNETYKRWELEFELSRKRKNEIFKSIELLTNEMIELEYQRGYHSEMDYFKEFDY